MLVLVLISSVLTLFQIYIGLTQLLVKVVCAGSIKFSGYIQLYSDIGSVQLCAGVIQPCSGVIQPCSGVIQPCSGVIQPCSGVIQPCSGVIQPCCRSGHCEVSHTD